LIAESGRITITFVNNKKFGNTKDPLDTRYVRRPGQSLDEQIASLHGEQLKWILIAGMLFAVEVVAWADYFAVRTLLVPIFFAIIFVSVLAYGSLVVLRNAKLVRNTQLGRDAEREVAHYLEELTRTTGCHVFHDVQGESDRGHKFNVDHVIVSKFGLFIVETKARSKLTKGETRILFDGDSVALTGHASDSQPIKQARMNAKYLSDKLHKGNTGRLYDVRAIGVFPGWWVDKDQMRIGKDVSVMPSKFLPYAFQNLSPVLAADEVNVIADMIRPWAEVERHLI
jgi:hypothetical protein